MIFKQNAKNYFEPINLFPNSVNFSCYLGNSSCCNEKYKPHVTKLLMMLKNGTGIYKALKSLFLVLIIFCWNLFSKNIISSLNVPFSHFYCLHDEICRPHLMNKYFFSFFEFLLKLPSYLNSFFYYSFTSLHKRVQQIDMPQNGFGLKEKDKIITHTTVHTSPKSTNFFNYTFFFKFWMSWIVFTKNNCSI